MPAAGAVMHAWPGSGALFQAYAVRSASLRRRAVPTSSWRSSRVLSVDLRSAVVPESASGPVAVRTGQGAGGLVVCGKPSHPLGRGGGQVAPAPFGSGGNPGGRADGFRMGQHPAGSAAHHRDEAQQDRLHRPPRRKAHKIQAAAEAGFLQVSLDRCGARAAATDGISPHHPTKPQFGLERRC